MTSSQLCREQRLFPSVCELEGGSLRRLRPFNREDCRLCVSSQMLKPRTRSGFEIDFSHNFALPRGLHSLIGRRSRCKGRTLLNDSVATTLLDLIFESRKSKVDACSCEISQLATNCIRYAIPTLAAHGHQGDLSKLYVGWSDSQKCRNEKRNIVECR